MSKGLIIAIVVAVLVLGGAAGYMLMNDDDSTSSSSSSQSNKTTNTDTKSSNSTSGNVFSLAEAGKAQKCTFSYSGSNGTGTGTMYSDGKGRGLMTLSATSEKGNSINSNTLLAGDKVYSWTTTNGQTFGFMADKSTYTTSGNNSSTNTSSAQTQDASQSYKISCTSWSVDEATLTPPANVNFQSMPTAPTP